MTKYSPRIKVVIRYPGSIIYAFSKIAGSVLLVNILGWIIEFIHKKMFISMIDKKAEYRPFDTENQDSRISIKDNPLNLSLLHHIQPATNIHE